MAKLYPPNIGGTIPAFCRDGGTVKLTVPFSMNRAVGTAEIAGFVLKMKTVNGTYIGTKTVKSGETSGASYDITEKMEVYFIYRRGKYVDRPYLYAVTDKKYLKEQFLKERKKDSLF